MASSPLVDPSLFTEPFYYSHPADGVIYPVLAEKIHTGAPDLHVAGLLLVAVSWTLTGLFLERIYRKLRVGGPNEDACRSRAIDGL